jgi:hypothetical protein
MAFSMGYSKEELSGKPPAPAGKYTLQVKKFKPKASKAGDSFSMNAEMEIIGNAEQEGKRVFASLNSKAGFIIVDFVHACGLQMEEVQDGNQGTDAAVYTIPGVWEDADKFPEDPSQWKYLGPLTNKTLEVELAETEYNGKKRNEVRQFFCSVPACPDKHSTNLIKG